MTLLKQEGVEFDERGLVEAHDEWQTGDRRYLAEGTMATLRTTPTASTEQVANRELIPA